MDIDRADWLEILASAHAFNGARQNTRLQNLCCNLFAATDVHVTFSEGINHENPQAKANWPAFLRRKK